MIIVGIKNENIVYSIIVNNEGYNVKEYHSDNFLQDWKDMIKDIINEKIKDDSHFVIFTPSVDQVKYTKKYIALINNEIQFVDENNDERSQFFLFFNNQE